MPNKTQTATKNLILEKNIIKENWAHDLIVYMCIELSSVTSTVITEYFLKTENFNRKVKRYHMHKHRCSYT